MGPKPFLIQGNSEHADVRVVPAYRPASKPLQYSRALFDCCISNVRLREFELSSRTAFRPWICCFLSGRSSANKSRFLASLVMTTPETLSAGRGRALLSAGLAELGRHFYAAETTGIFRYALIQRLGDFFPVFRSFQLRGVGRIGDKGDLRQDAGHVGADQHHEGCFLYAAVPQSRVLASQSAVKRLLHIARQFTRFLNLLFQRDLLDQVLKFED